MARSNDNSDRLPDDVRPNDPERAIRPSRLASRSQLREPRRATKPNGRRQPGVSMPLVSRLVGLETEYATLIADNEGMARNDLPSSLLVYMQLCEAIRRDQPTVVGIYDHDQMFLASGGAVTFESHPSLHTLPGGLIEIATPEVHSPEELLACQRSIDSLVSDAAKDIGLTVDLRILKNGADALGHVYGCQENYETDVASGAWLVVYRAFVCLLWAMQVCSLLVSLPLLAMVFALVFAVRVFKGQFWSHPGQSTDLFELLPSWVTNAMIGILRVVHFPTVVVLRFVARHVAFRTQRKYLTAMLISRVALCGSGEVDSNGCFRMSAKAMSIDKVADMGGFGGERPIYVYGHWLGQFCEKSFLSLGSTRQMFHRRQRLQIGLSDSNMSELAEYVKVGSVSLLLDMIENGWTDQLPIVRRPIESLHRLARDWDLIARVPTNQGEMSAIEIQNAYIKAADDFVQNTPINWRGESSVVLSRWRELLDAVTAFRLSAADTTAGIGRVDWLTKRWMIDRLGTTADWASRKKVDLRYHELSQDGYYSHLLELYPELRLIKEEEVERRRRSPPASSPAARRGWLIREFANSDERLQAEWSHAMIGEGRNRRRVDFVGASHP